MAVWKGKAEWTKQWKARNRSKVNTAHKIWLQKHPGYTRKRRDERLALIAKLKDKPCVDCGNKFPPVAMDYDHIRGRKTGTLSHLVSDAAWERVLKEIAKCELVCANCHRIRTAARGDSSKRY